MQHNGISTEGGIQLFAAVDLENNDNEVRALKLKGNPIAPSIRIRIRDEIEGNKNKNIPYRIVTNVAEDGTLEFFPRTAPKKGRGY